MALQFGLFRAAMPVVGWVAGRGVASSISAWDHWAVFALLAFIGGRAIVASLRDDEQEERPDPTHGTTLLALAVGVSFGMLDLSIWYPSLAIGIVAAATTVGMSLGGRLGKRFGRRLEVLGGV